MSIYLATDPASDGAAECIALKNAVSTAVEQLTEAGTAKALSRDPLSCR